MTGGLTTVQARWQTCDTVEEYTERASTHVAGEPVPVLVADRADLADSMAVADELYDHGVGVERRGSAVVIGLDPDARRGVEALLQHRVAVIRESIEAYSARPDGDLVVVAPYPLLTHDLLEQARRTADSAGATLRLLTGRDLPSVTWIVAKQLVRRREAVRGAAVVSGTANLPGDHGEVTVVGSRDVDTVSVDNVLLGRAWHQVVFHGHGTENSINLGEFTVCGRNDAVTSNDVTSTSVRPRCGYGLGCYKSDDTLIPLGRLRAAHVVMASCCNATFSPHRMYDPAYLLLLNGIDGPAQSLMVSPVVHDADHAELGGWISAMQRHRRVDTPPDMSDIHPFTTFLNVGLAAHDEDRSASASTSVLPETREIGDLNTTLRALVGSELLATSHPMHKSLLALARKVELEMARAVRGTPERWQSFLREVRADLQSIDLRLAKGIARHPEDPVLDFPQYFGDRSEVVPETVTSARCMCGLEAVEWQRRPLLGHLLPTTAMMCPRCGDVRFSTPSAPDVTLTMPADIAVGDPVRGQLRLLSPRRRVVHVGLFVPGYMRDAYPTPPPVTVKLKPGEEAQVQLDIPARRDITPQAYYATAFAVSDLSLVTVRQRFAMHPQGGPRG